LIEAAKHYGKSSDSLEESKKALQYCNFKIQGTCRRLEHQPNDGYIGTLFPSRMWGGPAMELGKSREGRMEQILWTKGIGSSDIIAIILLTYRLAKQVARGSF